MDIRIIGAEEHQQFVDQYAGDKDFLQSVKYGDFRQSQGDKVVYIGIFDGKELKGSSLVQIIRSKIKTFAHFPHGPLVDHNNKEAVNAFLDSVPEFCKEHGCDFARLNTLWPSEAEADFANKKFRESPIWWTNPQKTWILDLTQSEEDIKKNMKKSSRYEINRIEKFGVTTKVGNSPEDLDIFWDLHMETVKRQGFTPFPRKATEKELEVFGEDVQIFSAQHEGTYLSSAVILFTKDSAYYHQGSSLHSKAPVANAALWEAIKYAKERGCKEFNFWGVVDENDKKHPWWGLSRFKRGFGGEEKNYCKAFDCVVKPKYWINFVIENWRKKKRGY